MMHFKGFALVIFCLAWCGAFGAKKTGKDEKIDVAKYKGHKVIVGTETGYGNLRLETIILHSGQVFSHNKGNNEYTYQKTLKKRDVHHIFAIIGKAPISSFNHPGATSSFIEAYNGSGVTNYYMWGEAGVAVPEYILEDYTEILKIVR